MAAEIIGIDKILSYLNRYEFQKIKLSRGTEPIYLKRAADNETKETLIADFENWIEEFITPDNFKEYKLELFGTYSKEPSAKLSPVVKIAVAFNTKAAAAGETFGAISHAKNASPIDVDKYVTVAVENATLKAQLEQLEQKLDDLLDESDEAEEVGATEPQTIGQALNGVLMSKLDTIVDVVLAGLATKFTGVNTTPAINGVDDSDVLEEFKLIHPEIEQDLARLLSIAKNKPDFFKMLIMQLRNLA